jgi:hypothetical protein
MAAVGAQHVQSAFRIAYSLAVAILFILFVAFGSRTLFTEPEEFPASPSIEAEREDHFRNVFLAAGIAGVAAIVAGVALFRRVEAMPLGLVLGGIGAVSYGWVEWSRGPDEAGSSLLFVVVAAGLALVLGGGYYFLGRNGSEPGKRVQTQ